MAGFRKAKAEQAALKIGLYGAQGSGKTFTSLLIAEGLAKLNGKRVAYVDTEHGTDFYCKPVKERTVHPAAFDFDAIYTRSLTEILREVKSLDTSVHGVLVLDSITHLWESAKAAYEGRTTRAGTIPMNAWGAIKKPYKELMAVLLSSPLHVIICGREGNEFEEDERSGEMKKVGTKMKAEGETAYEPHILIHMQAVRSKTGEFVIQAVAEKDRTGILQGRVFTNPGWEMFTPILPLLGDHQARIETDEEVGSRDAEALAEAKREAERRSEELFRDFNARIDLAKTAEALKAVGAALTAEVKREMTTAHVNGLRDKYLEVAAKLGA